MCQSIKSQGQIWARLDALHRKRRDLEAQILASMRIIETQTCNISSEIAATFSGRIEDIETSRTHHSKVGFSFEMISIDDDLV